MDGLSIPEAARVLGVSIDTVRRRIHSGGLAGAKDERGRWLVSLEETDGFHAFTGSAGAAPVTSRDLEHAGALIAELRTQRDAMIHELEAARRDRIAAADERAELRILLGKALEQLQTPWWARNRRPRDPESRSAAGHDDALPMHESLARNLGQVE